MQSFWIILHSFIQFFLRSKLITSLFNFDSKTISIQTIKNKILKYFKDPEQILIDDNDNKLLKTVDLLISSETAKDVYYIFANDYDNFFLVFAVMTSQITFQKLIRFNLQNGDILKDFLEQFKSNNLEEFSQNTQNLILQEFEKCQNVLMSNVNTYDQRKGIDNISNKQYKFIKELFLDTLNQIESDNVKNNYKSTFSQQIKSKWKDIQNYLIFTKIFYDKIKSEKVSGIIHDKQDLKFKMLLIAMDYKITYNINDLRNPYRLQQKSDLYNKISKLPQQDLSIDKEMLNDYVNSHQKLDLKFLWSEIEKQINAQFKQEILQGEDKTLESIKEKLQTRNLKKLKEMKKDKKRSQFLLIRDIKRLSIIFNCQKDLQDQQNIIQNKFNDDNFQISDNFIVRIQEVSNLFSSKNKNINCDYKDLKIKFEMYDAKIKTSQQVECQLHIKNMQDWKEADHEFQDLIRIKYEDVKTVHNAVRTYEIQSNFQFQIYKTQINPVILFISLYLLVIAIIGFSYLLLQSKQTQKLTEAVYTPNIVENVNTFKTCVKQIDDTYSCKILYEDHTYGHQCLDNLHHSNVDQFIMGKNFICSVDYNRTIKCSQIENEKCVNNEQISNFFQDNQLNENIIKADISNKIICLHFLNNNVKCIDQSNLNDKIIPKPPLKILNFNQYFNLNSQKNLIDNTFKNVSNMEFSGIQDLKSDSIFAVTKSSYGTLCLIFNEYENNNQLSCFSGDNRDDKKQLFEFNFDLKYGARNLYIDPQLDFTCINQYKGEDNINTILKCKKFSFNELNIEEDYDLNLSTNENIVHFHSNHSGKHQCAVYNNGKTECYLNDGTRMGIPQMQDIKDLFMAEQRSIKSTLLTFFFSQNEIVLSNVVCGLSNNRQFYCKSDDTTEKIFWIIPLWPLSSISYQAKSQIYLPNI